MDFITSVKLAIYQQVAESSVMPDSLAIAQQLGASVPEVEQAFQILAGKRLLVLEPGSSASIRMAPPFSGIETPFEVLVGGKAYFANCIWDAFGIPAALGRPADLRTACAYSKEPVSLLINHGPPKTTGWVAHFAVPAAKWWEDIIYT